MAFVRRLALLIVPSLLLLTSPAGAYDAQIEADGPDMKRQASELRHENSPGKAPEASKESSSVWRLPFLTTVCC
jgi:hypothetical protein